VLLGDEEDNYDVVDVATGLYRTCLVFRPTNASASPKTQVRCFGHGVESSVPQISLQGIGKGSGGEGSVSQTKTSTAPVFSKNGGSWFNKDSLQEQNLGVAITTYVRCTFLLPAA